MCSDDDNDGDDAEEVKDQSSILQGMPGPKLKIIRSHHQERSSQGVLASAIASAKVDAMCSNQETTSTNQQIM